MKKETGKLEFKSNFDPDSGADWCKLIKGIVAMANSGGGEIVVGLSNDGEPSGADISAVLEMDSAAISDKIQRYIGTTPPDIIVRRLEEQGHVLASMRVEASSLPLVFVEPGTYSISPKQQQTEFSKGTVYFRHGAKSEPALPRDFEVFINKELKRRRKELFGNIRKVVLAPEGSKVVLKRADAAGTEPGISVPYRVSDAPDAIPVRGVVDASPYRSLQEELIGIVKGWKTDPAAFAAENQAWRLYSSRRTLELGDEERVCLLISAVHRHAPFFYWAVGLPKHRLVGAAGQLAGQPYPAPNMAAKLAHALGGDEGQRLLTDIANSKYFSAQRAAEKLLETVHDTDRIEKVVGAAPVVPVITPEGTKSVDLSGLSKLGAEDVLDKLLALGKQVDKQRAKRVDAWLYARELKHVK